MKVLVQTLGLLAAATLASFLIGALVRRSFQLPSLVFSGALISFLLFATTSIIWARHPDLTVPKAALLLNLLPLVFVWYDASKRRADGLGSLIRATLFGAIGAALTAIILFLSQFIFGVGPTFHFIVDQILPFFLGREFALLVAQYPSLMVNLGGETILRASAVFPDPHVAAYFFGLSGFLALGMFRTTGPMDAVIPPLLFESFYFDNKQFKNKLPTGVKNEKIDSDRNPNSTGDFRLCIHERKPKYK